MGRLGVLGLVRSTPGEHHVAVHDIPERGPEDEPHDVGGDVVRDLAAQIEPVAGDGQAGEGDEHAADIDQHEHEELAAALVGALVSEGPRTVDDPREDDGGRDGDDFGHHGGVAG